MQRIAIFLILIFVLNAKVFATELFEVHSNARAMGLGGAFAALAEGDESLWYNPAGIAKNGGVFWTIADPKIGVGDYVNDISTIMDSYEKLESASTFQEGLDDLMGVPVWANFSGKTAIMVPYFAAAYFYDTDISFVVDNPISPNLTTNYISDTGVALGTGFSIGGVLQMGFVGKYITRSGVRKDWGASTIADIVAGNSTPDIIFDSFTDVKGVGYGFDYGMNISLPTVVQPTFSFVWKNVGDTKFRAGLGEETPPSEEQDMVVGGALLIDAGLVSFSPAFEVRHIQDGDVQLGKKMHMGLEIGLPLIDLRTGLYQGYTAYGVGLNLGILQIDAASWGTELGDYPGQYEDRRYMVQATLNIGFDFGWGPAADMAKAGTGGKAASAAAGAGGSAAGGKRSWWSGTRGVKQRR